MIELIDAYVCDNLEVQGQKYVCKLDCNVFHNENQAVGHMYDAHHQKIEELLVALLNDMEQDQAGFFFSKLLYSDFVYAGIPPPIKEMSPEFPGVLAPDLSANIAAQNETTSQKKSKDKKKTVDDKDKASKFTGTKAYFAEEKDVKLLQLEKVLFGDTSKSKKKYLS